MFPKPTKILLNEFHIVGHLVVCSLTYIIVGLDFK